VTGPDHPQALRHPVAQQIPWQMVVENAASVGHAPSAGRQLRLARPSHISNIVVPQC